VYTPAAIARTLVDLSLGPLVQDESICRDRRASLRVLDPACGEGVFLEAAFDVLLAARRGDNKGHSAREIVEKNLFGVDVDKASVEATRRALLLRAGGEARLEETIKQGNSVVSDREVDALAMEWGGDAFDVVIGNPPYVRHELLLKSKAHLKRHYQAYHGMADLFVYFFERGLSLLKPGGRLAFIVTNKWLKAGYAEPLRKLLAKEARIESIIDFGHAPIFPDADTFPCIVTLAKARGKALYVTKYPREKLGEGDVLGYVERHRYEVPQHRLGAAPWSLEPPAIEALMAKIREKGVPLAEIAGTKGYRGIVTGYNEAFVLDKATRERILGEDPGSGEIIKPFLRGRDVKRWAVQKREEWLIFARRGIDIEAYPAVKRHLLSFKDGLEKRKNGTYQWFELQDAIDYYRLLEQPKIVYQEIQFHPAYALETSGMFPSNKVFFLPTADPWILAVLNSPLIWWYSWRYLPHMKDDTLSPVGEKMRVLPIAAPPAEAREMAWQAVKRLGVLEKNAEEAKALEGRLSAMVNRAYGLTDEEEKLVWETAPPRMPTLER